jgi:hypothetical protein
MGDEDLYTPLASLPRLAAYTWPIRPRLIYLLGQLPHRTTLVYDLKLLYDTNVVSNELPDQAPCLLVTPGARPTIPLCALADR